MKQTPFARWMKDNKPDPHGDKYNCVFEELSGSDIKTVVLAEMTPFANKIFTEHSAVRIFSSIKERLRWLSRQLAKADPDHEKYNKARAELSFGGFTDDELANHILTEETDDILNAVRERILWLDGCINTLAKLGNK